MSLAKVSGAPAAPAPAEDGWATPAHPEFAKTVVICVMLVICAFFFFLTAGRQANVAHVHAVGGVMSGLQQAIMHVSTVELTAMKNEGGPAEKKVARLLTPLITRRHLTLVTLLVGNAIAMEALPVFMDILVPKAVAIMLSVTAVVFFGEIIPQAVCLKWPLELAAFFAWLMYVLVGVLYPISAPIAGLLDWMLGHSNDAILSRGALRQLAMMHGESARGGPLNTDEVEIIIGALDLHTKTAGDTGVKLDNVFMVSLDTELNNATLGMITKAGHSRVPIFRGEDRTNIVGLLLVKQLVRLDHQVLVKNIEAIYPVLVAAKSVSLFALLKRFCTGESHMAVVVDHVDTPDGIRVCDYRKMSTDAVNVSRIVTLEDVLETLLRKDIRDEKDVWRPVAEDLEARMARAKLLKRQVSELTVRSNYSDARSLRSLASGDEYLTAYGSTTSL